MAVMVSRYLAPWAALVSVRAKLTEFVVVSWLGLQAHSCEPDSRTEVVCSEEVKVGVDQSRILENIKRRSCRRHAAKTETDVGRRRAEGEFRSRVLRWKGANLTANIADVAEGYTK